MLLSVAILAEQKRGERFAVFLWIFALWDIGYYVALWATVRWPYSPTNTGHCPFWRNKVRFVDAMAGLFL